VTARRPFVALALAVAVLAPVAAGALNGTPRRDRVVLSPGPDQYSALGGDDRVYGRAGDDELRGGPGFDTLAGEGDADDLLGGAGGDILSGGPDADTLSGGIGPDTLTGGAGADTLRGDQGADVLEARDGRADVEVVGGPGVDTCRVDHVDLPVTDCEAVDFDPVPSDAFTNRNWTPTAFDTCPAALHTEYTVVGPDGRLYPTWHPPTTVDPATGQTCTFGHEHGADPTGSDLYGWVQEHFAGPGQDDPAGLPFGYVSEELVEYAAANPGSPTRFEDHVGHKVEFVNDLRLLDQGGNYLYTEAAGGEVRVECDVLMKMHQGTHSADATVNNVHEVIYAVRCNDGTELISTTMAGFGNANEFNRSCAPGTVVDTGSASPYPDFGGRRTIPDQGCIDQFVLVNPANAAQGSDIWSIWENWEIETELVSAEGDTLAAFDPWLAVRNPSRYHRVDQPVGRVLDAAWAVDPADNGVVNRQPWLTPAAVEPYDFRSPDAPFDGAQRDFFVRETTVANAGGPDRWYTDPWGRNGTTEPFPGAICQLISPTDNTDQPALKRRLFGRDTDYGQDNGVHAPN